MSDWMFFHGKVSEQKKNIFIYYRSFHPSMLIPTTFCDSRPSVCWNTTPLSFQTSHRRVSTSRSATHMTIQPRPLTAKETRSAMYSVQIHPGRWSERERKRERERKKERDGFYAYTCNYSLERLILKCGLKGPSWLHIKQPSMFDHMTAMWSYLFVSTITIYLDAQHVPSSPSVGASVKRSSNQWAAFQLLPSNLLLRPWSLWACRSRSSWTPKLAQTR